MNVHLIQHVYVHIIIAWRIMPHIHSYNQMLQGGRAILYQKSPLVRSFNRNCHSSNAKTMYLQRRAQNEIHQTT